MTSYVISTSQTTTETLSANYDDLLVTSSGSIIDTTLSADGVEATADQQVITIDGLVYSINEYSGTGVDITGQTAVLNVNGQVQGDMGVEVDEGTRARISVGSQGAIGAGQFGIQFFGNMSDPAATTDTLDNAGDVSGDGNGVTAEYGGGDMIDNSGQISGGVAISFWEDAAKETVENSGTITGSANQVPTSSAILSGDSSVGIDVVNSGFITNDGSNAINGGAVLYLDDKSGTTSTIDNTGSISGSGYVIQSLSDILDISNSGTIHGSLYSAAAVDITTNSGLWQASAGSPTVFTLSAADDSITNSRTGTIGGAITIVSGGDAITNAGDIDGPVTFTGSGDTNNTDSLTNSGDITGAVTLSGGYNTVDNSGTLGGAVTIDHSHDTFNNAGSIDGNVALTAGSDTFTNAGTIDGEVRFWSPAETGSSLTNSGDITGNVTLPAPSSSVTNQGQIYGDIILGSSDTLINTGTIHGDVTLGASDTFDVSPGIVTGVINASSNDLFEFSGNFGDATINDFTGGSGSTQDTIQFAANDFSTFSQVQAASTQQGSDVVIRLDASDSITLNNVTLSSLVSADFTFV